jgi:hypothetical protein
MYSLRLSCEYFEGFRKRGLAVLRNWSFEGASVIGVFSVTVGLLKAVAYY